MINEKRLMDQFFEFVQIDSESGNEKAMGERLVKELESLGLEVWTDKAGETFGSNGFNVFAKLPASPDFAAAALAGTTGTGTADAAGTDDSARVAATAVGRPQPPPARQPVGIRAEIGHNF